MTYSKEFKESIVRKLLPPENRRLIDVSRETGIATSTIHGWLKDVKSGTIHISKDTGVCQRSLNEKLNLLLDYQKIPSETEGEWLRQQGLHSEHLVLFKQEISTIMSNKETDKDKRIKDLEKQLKQAQKELERKNDALAEMAALYTLKKKLEQIHEKDD